MPKEFKLGCQRPDVGKQQLDESINDGNLVKEEERLDMLKVGKPAPDFTAPAYYQGKFVEVKLSEYKDKWVLLCFYPGDFTFV